jgi:predicted phage terminase large subunit-like protein
LNDLIRMRGRPNDVESLVKQTAAVDGVAVSIRIEEEPGSSGKSLISHYSRDVLAGYDCRGIRSVGDKVTRANPFSAACERRDVRLIRGNWIGPFLDELCAFPVVSHDDQVDAVVGAFNQLHTAFKLSLGSTFAGSV